MSVYALVDPEAALARADLVVEVARAGDFAVTRSRRGRPRVHGHRRVHRSGPVPARTRCRVAGPYDEMLRPPLRSSCCRGCRCGSTTRTSVASLWTDEDAQLEADQALLASGRVDDRRDPRPRPDGRHPARRHAARPAGTASAACGRISSIRWRCTRPSTGSPCCWCRATRSSCATATSPGCSTRAARCDRGSTCRRWPTSSPPSSRAPARWVFDGVGALTPALHVEDGGRTELDPAEIRRRVEHALRTAPPAWDPYV